ncbi:MAG: AzlD domain-containing protein [Cloacibacillus evryensis]
MWVTAPSHTAALSPHRPQAAALVSSVLNYIPFAVIGSLVFPDILWATGDFKSSAAATVVAFLTGWFSGNILVVLPASIAAAFLATRLF